MGGGHLGFCDRKTIIHLFTDNKKIISDSRADINMILVSEPMFLGFRNPTIFAQRDKLSLKLSFAYCVAQLTKINPQLSPFSFPNSS